MLASRGAELTSGTVVLSQRRHVIAVEDVFDKAAMLGWNQVHDLTHRRFSPTVRARVLCWHDEVDAVGLVPYLVFDPLEVDFQARRRMPNCAEHTQSASLAYLGHHVATVAERKDRDIDPEHLGDIVLHAVLLTSNNLVVAFCPIPVAECSLVQLAGWEAGEFIFEIDRTRHLLPRQVLSAEAEQLLDERFVCGDIGHGLHDSLHLFSQVRIG